MIIQIMHKQGYGKKRIARELGVSINTVRKYLEARDKPHYKQRPIKPMKLDPYCAYIKNRLEQAQPDWIPATVMFREIQKQGYSGGLSRLRSFMRQQKPQITESPVVRFETEPGKQMQVDWAEFRGGKNRLAAFVATLGFSRASYIHFVTDEKLGTLLRCHELAFDYFGSIPFEILYDNMKTVIVERNYYGEGKHRLQSGFWDFSKHCHFIPRVCRPYRAQTKGKVERFIRYLRYSFYLPIVSQLKAQGKIADVDTLNQEVLVWLNRVANQRTHATTEKIPLQQLTIEQPHLQSCVLPYRLNPLSGAIEDTAAQSRYQLGHSTMACAKNSLQHDLSIYDALLMEGCK